VDGDEMPAIYVPETQWSVGGSYAPHDLVVKSTQPLDAVARTIREAVRDVDPGLPVYAIRSMEQVVKGSTASTRFQVQLFLVLGALALFLACLGVYALFAYDVHQRQREIGIRMALGATRPAVVAGILRRAARLLALGTVLGLPVSLLLGQVLERVLFRTPPADAAALLAATLVLAAAGVAASWIPARSAAGVDPARTLRNE
jgi:ABC-type antimicrobial peptide transport system permease subunit